MQTYYNNNPSLKKAMNGYLSFYFKGQDSFEKNTSGIYVKDPSAYLRYIVGGNVLSYDGKTDTSSLQAAHSLESLTVRQQKKLPQQLQRKKPVIRTCGTL